MGQDKFKNSILTFLALLMGVSGLLSIPAFAAGNPNCTNAAGDVLPLEQCHPTYNYVDDSQYEHCGISCTLENADNNILIQVKYKFNKLELLSQAAAGQPASQASGSPTPTSLTGVETDILGAFCISSHEAPDDCRHRYEQVEITRLNEMRNTLVQNMAQLEELKNSSNPAAVEEGSEISSSGLKKQVPYLWTLSDLDTDFRWLQNSHQAHKFSYNDWINQLPSRPTQLPSKPTEAAFDSIVANPNQQSGGSNPYSAPDKKALQDAVQDYNYLGLASSVQGSSPANALPDPKAAYRGSTRPDWEKEEHIDAATAKDKSQNISSNSITTQTDRNAFNDARNWVLDAANKGAGNAVPSRRTPASSGKVVSPNQIKLQSGGFSKNSNSYPNSNAQVVNSNPNAEITVTFDPDQIRDAIHNLGSSLQ